MAISLNQDELVTDLTRRTEAFIADVVLLVEDGSPVRWTGSATRDGATCRTRPDKRACSTSTSPPNSAARACR